MSAKTNNESNSDKKNARTAADVKRTRTTILVAAIVVVIVGFIAGFAIYQNQVRPFNATIISVDDAEIDMRYFLKRIAMSGKQSMEMLSTLSEEAILRKVAPQPPYNIEVTEEDVDQYARDIAKGSDDSIDESEFNEWYRQRVNESRLSDDEFRELLRTSLLSELMTEYLRERVPETAEQVKLHLITVRDVPTGREVKERYESGEDFADLAEEYSTDTILKEQKGDIGWFPRAALDNTLRYAAFELEVGECSDPFVLGERDNESTVVIMVSGREEREVDERAMESMKAVVLEDWLQEQFKLHDVQFYGLDRTTGYDSGTDAWVNWQLMRMKRDEQPDPAEQGQGQGQG